MLGPSAGANAIRLFMNSSASAAPAVLSRPLTLKDVSIAPPSAEVIQERLKAHDERVVPAPGEQRDAVALLFGAVEELGDVFELVPGVGHREIALVLRLERGLLLGILEPVLAVGKADRVGLAGRREVRAASPGYSHR